MLACAGNSKKMLNDVIVVKEFATNMLTEYF